MGKPAFLSSHPFVEERNSFVCMTVVIVQLFIFFFIYRFKMELFKGIIAAIITMTLSSQTLCAPPQSKPTTIQILVTYVIPSKTANATNEV